MHQSFHLPQPDQPQRWVTHQPQRWVTHGPIRRRVGHVLLECRSGNHGDGVYTMVPLKTVLSPLHVSRIGNGLGALTSEALAREIAGRRQIARALALYRTDYAFDEHRDAAPETAHERMAILSRLRDRLAGVTPVDLPPRVRRLDYRNITSTVSRDRVQENISRPPIVDILLSEPKAPARRVEIETSGWSTSGAMAAAIGCAELQNLMAVIVLRDPQPRSLSWASVFLPYIAARPASEQRQLIRRLAGIGG